MHRARFGPSCTSAGMGSSHETVAGWVGQHSGFHAAALPVSLMDEKTQTHLCKPGTLLEPEAGCPLWPSVLQNMGSTPADANRRLWSTQHTSAFDAGRSFLHKGLFQSNLSFFAQRPVRRVFTRFMQCT